MALFPHKLHNTHSIPVSSLLSKVTPQPGPSPNCSFTIAHAEKQKLAISTKPKLIDTRSKPNLVDGTDKDKVYVPSFDVESSTTDVT